MNDLNALSGSSLLRAGYADGIVTVHGEIDIATCDRFRTILEAAIDNGVRSEERGPPKEAHIDLAGVGFIGVAGTRELVSAATNRRHDLELVVHNGPEMLERLLRLMWGRVPGLRLEQTRRPRRRQGPHPERSEPPGERRLGAAG